ncbi:MAG: V-type ATP synthase subunit D [Chlamydiae bacterium]|nr:V-type ATP synthase subunit D [Chlamydiota bacterium]
MLSEIRLSKIELKNQQNSLEQFKRYLPVLELKKILLQSVLSQLDVELLQSESKKIENQRRLMSVSALFAKPGMKEFTDSMRVLSIQRGEENIAGIELPVFKGVEFAPVESLVGSVPLNAFSLRGIFEEVMEIICRHQVLLERRKILEKELRDVTVKVNLFDKILIPRAEANIKKIKIALDDQQLAQIANAKKAKELILKKGAR